MREDWGALRAFGSQSMGPTGRAMFGEFTTNLNHLMGNLDNVAKLSNFPSMYSKSSSVLNPVFGPIVKYSEIL